MRSIQIWRWDRSDKSYEKKNDRRQHNERSKHSNQDANSFKELNCGSPKMNKCFHSQKYVTGSLTAQQHCRRLTTLNPHGLVVKASELLGITQVMNTARKGVI